MRQTAQLRPGDVREHALVRAHQDVRFAAGAPFGSGATR
jgi:hypothetical protein